MKQLDSKLIKLLPAETALVFKVLPIMLAKNRFHLAASKHPDADSAAELSFVLGNEVSFEIWPETAIEAGLRRYYDLPVRKKKPSAGRLFSIVNKLDETSKFEQNIDDLSATNKVNELITYAIHQNASDIHIEPFEEALRVRFRVDGALRIDEMLDKILMNPIISRIKIMADLDIAERRRPQDGRIRVSDGTRNIDLRVSTLPTDFGEKVVLRILDKGAMALDIKHLGLDSHESNILKQAVSAPYGIVLVTGPTGCGKTTTLYSALNYLNSDEINILTIEDPIEYNLTGVNQAHVRANIGFTFASALRTFLRQDPDVIMVGEIRDRETAEIAVRAALTGHLVLSTLHTNDAASAITRLPDMGVKSFLVASSIRLIIAQRLVRKICENCKQEAPPLSEKMDNLDERERALVAQSFCGAGCSTCFDTGYSGRTAIYEMMPVDNEIARMITRNRTSQEIKQKAVAGGMKTLRASGWQKVSAGTTTVEEVLKETRA